MRGRLGVLLLALSVATAARAQGILSLDASADPAFGGSDLGQKPTSPPPASDGLLGDSFGMRTALAQHDLSFGGQLLFDVTKVFRGGLDTEATPIRYLLDLHLALDTTRYSGDAAPSMAYLDFQSHDQSDNRDTAVGDIQGFNNIDSIRFVQFSQAWIKFAFPNLPVRLKIGKMDANTDAGVGNSSTTDAFSFIEHSVDFMHSAAVYTPTMFPMVTFPDPAPGAQLFAGDARGPYAGAGAYYSNQRQRFLDLVGNPSLIERTTGGTFFIAEAGAHWTLFHNPAHAGLGGWYHTGRFPVTNDLLDSGGLNTKAGAGGGYGFVDLSLYQEKSGDTVRRDLGLFFHAGAADSVTSPMDQAATGGLVATGFVPGRPDDAVGTLVTWSHLSNDALAHHFELATELYYKCKLFPGAFLRPTLQYIVNPTGQLPDAALATLRIELDF